MHNIKSNLKYVPNALHFNSVITMDNNNKTLLYMYSIESIVNPTTYNDTFHTLSIKSKYVINAINSAILGLPSYFPCKDSFELRNKEGICMNTRLIYIGSHWFTREELLHVQRYHQAVLAWSCDETFPSKHETCTCQSAEEWSRSSGGACYYVIPGSCALKTQVSPHVEPHVEPHIQPSVQPHVQPSVQPPVQPPVRPHVQPQPVTFDCPINWLNSLQNAANIAQCMIRKLLTQREQLLHRNTSAARKTAARKNSPSKHHASSLTTASTLNTSNNESARKIYPSHDNLDGKLLSHTLGYLCYHDTTRKSKKLSDIMYAHITYYHYYAKKGRLSINQLNTLLADPSHQLVPVIGISAKFTLENLLCPSSVILPVLEQNPPNNMHILPEICEIVGNLSDFYVGLALPCVVWRVQSMFLAYECIVYINGLYTHRYTYVHTYIHIIIYIHIYYINIFI